MMHAETRAGSNPLRPAAANPSVTLCPPCPSVFHACSCASLCAPRHGLTALPVACTPGCSTSCLAGNFRAYKSFFNLKC